MTTYRVANQTELTAAVTKIKGGDTLLLEAGTYTKLELNGNSRSMKNVDFDSPVRIASVDPGKPAVIQALVVTNASNVVLDDLKFDHIGRADAFNVIGSSKITIRDSTFDGHIGRDGYGEGRALRVTYSEDIAFENNKIKNFANGTSFSNVDNLLFRGNDISGTSNDASTFGAVTNVLIEGNAYHDQHSSAAHKHKDSIQFWTSPYEAHSKNVVIRDNTFSNKEGAHTIFMGSEMAVKNPQTAFENILIEGNRLSTGHVHGIVVEHANGVVIRDNVLERFPGLEAKQITTPVITVGEKSVNVTIEDNTVASVQRAVNATWDIHGNVVTTSSLDHWPGRISAALRGEASDVYKAWKAGADGATVDFSDLVGESAPGAQHPGGPIPPIAPTPPTIPPVGQQPPPPTAADHFEFLAWRENDGHRGAYDLDFADGDTFTIRGYDRGTMRGEAGGNPIGDTNEGRFVKLDSIVDVAEIAANSPGVTATIRSGDVHMRVNQDAYVDTFVLEDMAQAFRAANHADLF